MRVCIVYDCLYPYTIGGAERWYRNLAERLASSGHEVTFLTRRQWERATDPTSPAFASSPVSPRMELYARRAAAHRCRRSSSGSASSAPACATARRYDVVHTASFPYFSLLAAAARAAARRLPARSSTGTRSGRATTGASTSAPLGGRIGWRVQRACLRVPQRAFCFSRLHERRLRERGLRGDADAPRGSVRRPVDAPAARPARPVAVFAGRHIPEKRVPALVPALARRAAAIPDLRGEIYGDGPERERRPARDRRARARRRVGAPGFVDAAVLEDALATRALPRAAVATRGLRPRRRSRPRRAACRSSSSTGPDNAATELVEEGVERRVAASDSADASSRAAIVRVHDGGPELRASAAAWFRANAERLSFERSFADACWRTYAERLSGRSSTSCLTPAAAATPMSTCSRGCRATASSALLSRAAAQAWTGDRRAAGVADAARRARLTTSLHVHGEAAASTLCLPLLAATSVGRDAARAAPAAPCSTACGGAAAALNLQAARARGRPNDLRLERGAPAARRRDRRRSGAPRAGRSTTASDACRAVRAPERSACASELGLHEPDVVGIWVGSLDERRDPLAVVRAAERDVDAAV